MSQTDAGTAWFLAQIKPNSDRIAERHLTQQGFPVFLPRVEETRRAAGRFVNREVPLFAGYVFVALDPGGGGWCSVNATRGITRLVSFGDRPAAVPDDLVEGLRARCDGAGLLQPAEPGDRVALTRGPFAEFVGTVETITPDRRVWVLLDLLGGRTRVATDPDNLRQA